MELHPHEVEILKALKEKKIAEEVAEESGLGQDAVMRASSWLSTKGLVEIERKVTEEVSLGKEGKEYSEKGLPERQIIGRVTGIFSPDERIKTLENGGILLDDIRSWIGKGSTCYEHADDRGKWTVVHWDISQEQFNIAIGWLRRKNQAEFKKEGDETYIKIINSELTNDERLLIKLRNEGKVDVIDLSRKEEEGLNLLKQRKNVIEINERKEIFIETTEKGNALRKKLLDEKIKPSVSQLTPDLLISGEWKNVEFRGYDAEIYVSPKCAAKKHPLQRAIDQIRDIFLEMGFTEVSGPLIESAFWNFDALFQPQDHPARDMHDTFYLKNPKSVEIPEFDRLKERIKETHENGGDTGSTGWGGKWDEKVARKTLLRTHTTAVTARYLATLDKDALPKKIFCIGKTFRNEAIDYKHLPEFYQVEGIVADEEVNFKNLLGILKRFYDEMGFEKIRFRPAYFPYTEMSVEPEAYLESRGEWVELGGAGIFREEVVKPLLGFSCPVLAWGLGLDRVIAMKLGLEDIRELYKSDLDWLRKAAVSKQ